MWNLARGLTALGAEVTVLTTNAKQKGVVDVPTERTEEGVRIITSPIFARGQSKLASRFGVSVSFWREIVKHTRGADIIHINGFWGLGPVVAVLACAKFGQPMVVSTRGNLQENAINDKALKKRLAFALGVRGLLRAATAIHYTTLLEENWSPEWARGLPCIIVPNPMEMKPQADGEAFRAGLGIGAETVVLGSIGRIHRRKGFEIVARALGKGSRRDIIWAVVGADEGYREELVRLAKELGIDSRLKLVGELKGEQLTQAYAGIDCLVLPSHGENFGNVVVEAAIQGTPSIVSDQLGLMAWIAENDTGIVLPLEVDAWSETLGALSREEIIQRWEPHRLTMLAKASFSIEVVAQQMLEHYERILSNHIYK